MEGPSRDPQRSDIIQEVRDEKPAADGGLVAWLGVAGAWLMFFITCQGPCWLFWSLRSLLQISDAILIL
ncbi:hypothetical protein NXS19_002995 [Fusarium pseudograminearum]|nr:hypothetical protein NXS19_002995 [Fusarium pseudograminearum]